MAKIIQLPPHMADLIAAGEVVERPASVVKELMENAVDAGARKITVEIQNGGMTFLRVMDDGCGMSPEDAPTAFLRHATSKLRRKEDLEAIGTLGFRGEALAATAAVSRVDLLTRTPDAQLGTHLHLEGGKVLEQEPAGCPAGTTIIVRDLFFNTPARMKFMKRDTAEASAVFSAVQKQALAHPEISVRFLKDGQEQLHTPGDGDRKAAIYSVLGRQTAAELVEVDSSWEQLSVSGFVSRPTATRGTRSYQIFFVNDRFVRSRTLTAALEEAYRNQIQTGRFPMCVLNLRMPLASVDVNVHPAKTEVRFLKEKEVFDCVYYGVLAALDRTPGQVAMRLPERKDAPAPELPEIRTPKPAPEAGRAAPRQDFYRTMTAWEYKQFAAALEKGPKAEPSRTLVEQARTTLPLREQVILPTLSAPVQPSPRTPAPPAPRVDAPAAQQTMTQQAEPFRIVGEVLNTYILAEQGETVVFIDKHAAHERINFEKLRAQGVQIMGQRLLEPKLCGFDREEAEILCRHRELLLSLGFELDDLGDGTLLLRQMPADLSADDAEGSLSEIAGHLQNGKADTPEQLREQALHTIACKASIKGGWVTSAEELQTLAAQVLSREDLKYCPHGRPICLVLTKKQLEKQFKR